MERRTRAAQGDDMSPLPLPKPLGHLHSDGDFCQERMIDPHATGWPVDLFTDDQMRAYAAAAVEAEREQCARICDTTPPYPFRASIEAAHAIRARSKAPAT